MIPYSINISDLKKNNKIKLFTPFNTQPQSEEQMLFLLEKKAFVMKYQKCFVFNEEYKDQGIVWTLVNNVSKKKCIFIINDSKDYFTSTIPKGILVVRRF